MEVKYLPQNFQNDWMIQCVPLKTLQGTYGVCAKEVILLRLLPNEPKNSVDSIFFGHIHTVKAVMAESENLIFTHKGTSI
jgi:hypothetical protein